MIGDALVLQESLAALLDELAGLFEARAFLATQRFTQSADMTHIARKKAYEEAARDTRNLADRLRE